MEFFKDLGQRHEKLKKRIHNFRIPLKPWQRALVLPIYISIGAVLPAYLAWGYISKKQEELLAEGGAMNRDAIGVRDRDAIIRRREHHRRQMGALQRNMERKGVEEISLQEKERDLK